MSVVLATRPTTTALQPIDDAFVRVIQWVAASGYFKEAKDEAQAAVKMLIGRELGLQPMASMMGIDIIDTQRGPRPRLSANIMAGLIKASGEYDYGSSTSATSASVTVYRRLPDGTTEGVGTVTYSIEEARKAGIARAGSPWEKFTPDMLFARAMSRTKRLVPHLFLGLSGNVDVILPEELDDEPMSADQRKALFAQLNDLDITDRDRRLMWASNVLGREVTTFTDLTRTDAGVLLEWLVQPVENADQAGGADETIKRARLVPPHHEEVHPTVDPDPPSVDPERGAVGQSPRPSVPVHRQPTTSASTSATMHLANAAPQESWAVGGDWQRADPADPGDSPTASGSLAEGATVISDNGDSDRHTELIFKIAAAHSEWKRTMPKGADAWFNGFLAHVKRSNLNECDIEELEAGWDWLVALNRAK